MENLLKHIVDYLKYLNETESFSVTVHFSENILRRLPRPALEALLPFNNHEHSYCMAVKARGGRAKCISCQKEILSDGEKTESFMRVCHAGVSEYIFPVWENGERIAYIALSGFRPNTPPDGVTDIELWNSLSEADIPKEQLDARIAPLCLMLESFFSDCHIQGDSEYKLILQFLNEYHTDTDLSSLCEHFGRSASHISHMFKKKSGKTVSAYCNDLKLEDAKRLLKTTSRSVTEIAFDAGFHDVSYFVRLFRENVKMSPLRYRKAFRDTE